MTKLQWLVICGAVLLFFVMYFGCSQTPARQKALEKTRALNAQSTNLSALLADAKVSLSTEQANMILALESKLQAAESELGKVEALKALSAKWFDFGRPAISGAYARQIAEIENTEESWAISGTTFAIGIQRSADDKVKSYCTEQAVQSFENAISLNPENLDHKVNLALCYVENPPKTEPMKGIQMLLRLNEQNPNNVLVLNNLGRLAIRTGQFDRALQRLEKAWSLDPNNSDTACLLVQAYRGVGNEAKARQMSERCEAEL